MDRRSSVPLDNTTHGKELKKSEKLKELKPLALRRQKLGIQKLSH